MHGAKVLVVEDDDDIRELVRYNLAREGFRVSCASTGEEGLRKARSGGPDLIVLDLMLPGIDGLRVCKALRADPATKAIPVVMLTARGQDADIVAGLEAGADDYVTKPFSPRVLIARTRALLRRHKAEGEQGETRLIARGEVVIDVARHEVTVGGKPVELTHTEFELLKFLAGRPGIVFDRYQIVNALHGEDYPVTERSVDVQVAGLRKKLRSGGDCIETVRGAGYRFRDRCR